MPANRAIPLLLLLLTATSAAGQTPDSVPSAPPVARGPAHVRLWQVGAALGAIGLSSMADKGLRNWVVDHRTQGEQDLAGNWQKWGEGPIPVGITLGTLGAGLIFQQPEVTRTGGRLATSLVAVTLLGRGLKKAIGRARPSEGGGDPFVFDPFGKFNSFPSGHTITAFAVSTTLADAIHNRWADIGLYTLAAGTGASRIVGDHHWLSDVVTSGILGLTTAKVVDGKWTIFGLHSPEFLTGPQGAALKWTTDLPLLRGTGTRRISPP